MSTRVDRRGNRLLAGQLGQGTLDLGRIAGAEEVDVNEQRVELIERVLEIGRYEPPRDRIEMSHLVRSQGILNGPLLFDF